jgi:hypothetical protein
MVTTHNPHWNILSIRDPQLSTLPRNQGRGVDRAYVRAAFMPPTVRARLIAPTRLPHCSTHRIMNIYADESPDAINQVSTLFVGIYRTHAQFYSTWEVLHRGGGRYAAHI